MTIIYILIALLAAVAAILITLYNGLVRKRNLLREAWSGIDVQLKRRHDLIPGLIETVKGYARHEEGIFSNLAQLRSEALRATSPDERGHAEAALTQSLRSVFAIAENYPELKASQNFRDFQQALQQVETELQLARRYYNGSARDYNTSIETFPSVLIAPALGFKSASFFELDDDAARNTPKIAF